MHIIYHNKQRRFDDRFSFKNSKNKLKQLNNGQLSPSSHSKYSNSPLSLRLADWAWLECIVGASFFHYCCRQTTRRDVYGIPHQGHEEKLCNTGTHSITIGSISSKAWPPGSFAINLRPQASSKGVLRLQKAFTLPLFVLHNTQEPCVQGKYILGFGGKPSNNQMHILPIAFCL